MSTYTQRNHNNVLASELTLGEVLRTSYWPPSHTRSLQITFPHWHNSPVSPLIIVERTESPGWLVAESNSNSRL